MLRTTIPSPTPTARSHGPASSTSMAQPFQPQSLLPMGFAARIKALEDTQQEQAAKIEALEKELAEKNDKINTLEKHMNPFNLIARIEALERYNTELAARRTESVAQLSDLKLLDQEASNGFRLRTADLQPNDFEGMLAAYGTTVSTVLNHHQRSLQTLHQYHSTKTRAGMLYPGQAQPAVAYPQYGVYQYPAVTAYGSCQIHVQPHPCRFCRRF